MRIRASIPAATQVAAVTASLLVGLAAAVGGTVSPAAAAPATPVTVWLAGDSTVANNSSNGAVGWGVSFGSLFTNASVQNQAIGGRSIQTWLYEGNVTSTKNSAGECALSSGTYSSRWTTVLNGMRSGDYLMVQFGINDGDSACPRHVGAARYRELLTVMAQAAKTRGVHPIFLTPPAYINCSGSTATGNRGFLSDTRTAAASNNVPLVDLNALSVALYNEQKLCPNNGDYTQGRVGDFFANDHTHFSANGARQIAAAIAADLGRQQIPLAQWLTSNPTTPKPTTPTPTTPTPTTPKPTTPATTTPAPTTPKPSTPAPTTTTPPASTSTGGSGSTCSAAFAVTNAWTGGFQGGITVGRIPSGTSGWTVTLTLASGQSVRQLWGGVATTNGNRITVKNESWNGNLGQGAASIGLLVDGPATTPAVSCTTA